MNCEIRGPQLDLLKKQVDEIKNLLEEGLRTPLLIVDSNASLRSSSEQSITDNLGLTNELKTTKEQLEVVKKENEKLKYQLTHVLRSCAEKDNLISQLPKPPLGS